MPLKSAEDKRESFTGRESNVIKMQVVSSEKGGGRENNK
jgi:hypothetical protein